MSDQLKIEEKKPVKICGFKQNCYKIGTTGGIVGVANFPNKEQLKYVSLEKVALPNGYVEELVEKDYPINSDSVSSYADGADYRNDPAQAVANAPARVNLGDVREAQKFLENPQNALRIMQDTCAKLEKYYEETKKQESVKVEEVSNGEQV